MPENNLDIVDNESTNNNENQNHNNMQENNFLSRLVYKNVGLEKSVNDETAKKGRGRPKKALRKMKPVQKEKDSEEENTDESEKESDEQSEKGESESELQSAKKKRGRPRKSELSPPNKSRVVTYSEEETDIETQSSERSINDETAKKGRGRPKKALRKMKPVQKEKDSEEENTDESEKESDEQSEKVKLSDKKLTPESDNSSVKEESHSDDSVVEKEDNPDDSSDGEEFQPDVSSADEEMVVAKLKRSSRKTHLAKEETKPESGPKKRGRPRKRSFSDDESESKSEPERVAKKRGRPRKSELSSRKKSRMIHSEGETKNLVKSKRVGEKRGRPRKNNTINYFEGESESELKSAKKKRGRPRKSELSRVNKSRVITDSEEETEIETQSSERVLMRDISNPCELVPRLCEWMYSNGWASGTGGGVSIKQDGHIYMAPSAVQKEQIKPSEIFVLNQCGEVENRPGDSLKLTECFPLFMNAYQIRDAGAVLHSHSIYAVLASSVGEEFTITNMEMIKGIMMGSSSMAHKNTDKLVVPIIDNALHERELTQRMKDAILKYENSNAVLVRNHGVYIWGKDWVKAKAHAECYHYLFELAVKMKQFGLDT